MYTVNAGKYTMQKFLPIAMLALTAFVLIGGSTGMAALAVKKETSTIDNAKQIIIKNGQETLVINVNSVPGPKGDTGAAGSNGANGTNGANGEQGPQGVPGIAGQNGTNGAQGIQGEVGPQGSPGANSTVPGPQGPIGLTGPAGQNGTTTIIVCTANSTNPECGNTPTPPVNATHK